jgi:hypothetical protein
VLNATFNNISAISWRWILLVEETKYPEKTTDLSQVTDKLYHIMLSRVHLAWAGFELTILLVKSTNCTGSCKSNYHTITTAPHLWSLCCGVLLFISSNCTLLCVFFNYFIKLYTIVRVLQLFHQTVHYCACSSTIMHYNYCHNLELIWGGQRRLLTLSSYTIWLII